MTPRFSDCPVCGAHAERFAAFGHPPRPHAQCPRCGALERHRLVWCFFTRATALLDGRRKRRLLHVAPEPCLRARLTRIDHLTYVSADFADPEAMVLLDLVHAPFRDESFDVIYCSHVLEHIPDDRAAMCELGRILAASGWAVLNVPVTAAATFEDPTITDPEERQRLFGQRDHVRQYGPDYADRLALAGWRVSRLSAEQIAGAEQACRWAIDTPAAGDIFLCTKQQAAYGD